MSRDIIENLKIILIVFGFVAFLVPFMKKMAYHVGAIDVPRTRHIHKREMPKLGGVAIFLGFLLGYMLFCEQTPQMISILIGSFIIILTGIFDDIKPLKPKVKFVGQLIASIIVVYYGGIVMQDVSAYGIYIDFGIFAKPLTILFIVALINCMNFVDGMDGLAAGIAEIYFITISIIIYITGIYNGLDASLTLIMIGAVFGFLIYNFYPAKIFMGDSGSMFLGYIISVISLLGFKNVTITSFVVPALILAVPILDTLFAIIRRLLKKESPAKADREHLHHQIYNRTSSQLKTVLIIYMINILFSAASIEYVAGNPDLGQIIYVIILIIILWFVFFTNIIFDTKKLRNDIKNVLKKVN